MQNNLNVQIIVYVVTVPPAIEAAPAPSAAPFLADHDFEE